MKFENPSICIPKSKIAVHTNTYISLNFELTHGRVPFRLRQRQPRSQPLEDLERLLPRGDRGALERVLDGVDVLGQRRPRLHQGRRRCGGGRGRTGGRGEPGVVDCNVQEYNKFGSNFEKLLTDPSFKDYEDFENEIS